MRCNNDCRRDRHNYMPYSENDGRYAHEMCNTVVRRTLEPVLVAKIYNQQIVEEIPHSAMSMTVDNTARVNACADEIPMCECGCDDPVEY